MRDRCVNYSQGTVGRFSSGSIVNLAEMNVVVVVCAVAARKQGVILVRHQCVKINAGEEILEIT